MLKHIVMFSSGVASWVAAKRVAERYSTNDLILLFADTLIEDEDNYRFLIEGGANILGKQISFDYQIPPIWEMESRKEKLKTIATHYNQVFEGSLIWLQDNRHIWEAIQDERWLNHRSAACSKILKREVCRRFLEEKFEPERAIVYVGIDFNEFERMAGIQKGWQPYQVQAPLCWDDLEWCDRLGQFKRLEQENIKPPRLYQLGFAHANCGGDCVRAGKSQWLQLLKTFPDVYQWHSEQEKSFQAAIAKDITILREQVKGELKRVSLKEFAKRPQQLDLFQDWGGCGCFTSDE